MTPRWLMSRRRLLRGTAGAALALPFLDAMARPGRARAQIAPKRFVTFYTGGGTVLNQWRPTGTETSFTFRSMNAPLEPIKQHITLLDGLELQVTREGFGHQHSRGMGALLTGQPLLAGPYDTGGGPCGFADGPSLDQILGAHLGKTTKFKTLEMGVRWPSTNGGNGNVSPSNIIVFSGPNQPLPLAADPGAIYQRLFTDLATDTTQLAAQRARGKSILDAAAEEFRLLSGRLGTADRTRLDAHQTKIRQLERSLATISTGSAGCQAPAREAISDYKLDQNLPAIGKAMMDMMVMAFACDLTRVVTMQWCDSSGRQTFPWLGLNQNHHAYQHDQGYQPDNIIKINTWYMQQLAYLTQALVAEKDAGGGSILDSSCIYVCTEIQMPSDHIQTDMPFMLVGGAGGAFKTGRWLKVPRTPHNNLLVSFMNAYGMPGNTFGKPQYCTGPLAGLA